MVFNLNLILGILVVWLVIISFFIFRLRKHYNKLIRGTSRATLSEVLEKILKTQEVSDKRIDELVKKAEETDKASLAHIQKVGLLRFNPFAEVGSDQSFVLALLDGEDNGVVVTSLTSRTGTHWYGKTVKKGQGIEHELSSEEKEAIKKAKNLKE